MPVLIKTNAATELRITNGQEATVAGWDAEEIEGKKYLRTLFVRLTNPTKDIQLPELPNNVVPLTRNKTSGYYTLPTGYMMAIQRQQVQVLPNFAMTDYASQGKTRNVNVVDLTYCQSHQAIYTCLSRSASAGDTLILSNFDTGLIRGNLNGYLRQEYRHLEMLDDITTMAHNGSLPASFKLDCGRKEMIKQYQSTFGRKYNPRTMPKAIRWQNEDLSSDIADEVPYNAKQNKRPRPDSTADPAAAKKKTTE